MRFSLTIIFATLALAMVLALPANVFAQDNKAFVDYRQKVMQSLGSNMGGIAEILKQKLPHTANIAGHAQNINVSAKMITGAFEKQIIEGKNRAKPEIWKDWEKFSENVRKLQMESDKLIQVAGSGDMKAIVAQVQATGKVCGGCHDQFREKKKM